MAAEVLHKVVMNLQFAALCECGGFLNGCILFDFVLKLNHRAPTTLSFLSLRAGVCY